MSVPTPSPHFVSSLVSSKLRLSSTRGRSFVYIHPYNAMKMNSLKA